MLFRVHHQFGHSDVEAETPDQARAVAQKPYAKTLVIKKVKRLKNG